MTATRRVVAAATAVEAGLAVWANRGQLAAAPARGDEPRMVPVDYAEVFYSCYRFPPETLTAERLLVSVDADGFANRMSTGLRPADGSGSPYGGVRILHGVGDPRDGIEVFALTSGEHPKAELKVVLKLETE